ncbi:MAG TPA: hypothetical protein DER33_02545 [Syntrophomonas sp.]|jgi:hypothetical protein|nr:hypothetical protein [Syntrophomonas sp.]HCF70464.1 hypothetical protein [Syntrophomonas sp.]
MTSKRCIWLVGILLGMLFSNLWPLLPCQALVWADLQQHWAKTDIEKMAAQGMVAGYPDGNFHPEQAISRAEFAVLISRAMTMTMTGYPVSSNPYRAFTDVKMEDWFCPHIMKPAVAKIIPGGENGMFLPQEPVQRQEAAQMLWSWMQVQGLALDLKDEEVFQFSDNQSIEARAQTAVKRLTRLRVFYGYPDQSFRPTDPMTRAEACLAVNRTLIVIKKQQDFIKTMQPEVPERPLSSSPDGSSGKETWLPSTPPNQPDGPISNYLQFRVRAHK